VRGLSHSRAIYSLSRLLSLKLFVLPIMLLWLAAMAGCGGDETKTSVSRLQFDALNRQVAASSKLLGDSLQQSLISLPAKKLMTELQPEQRFGQIEIPRLGIREWIVQGTSKEALEKGAGHIEGTSMPGLGGNFALAGDRVLYTSPFLRLDQLEVGDEVLIHLPYADFTYKAEVKTNVDPSEVSVLKPRGYDSVTLSTCDPPWGLSTRIIIFARLAESAPKA